MMYQEFGNLVGTMEDWRMVLIYIDRSIFQSTTNKKKTIFSQNSIQVAQAAGP